MAPTPTPPPRLAQALLQIDPLTREKISHLIHDAGHLTCRTDGPQPGPQGQIETRTPLAEQIAELAALGIVGTHLPLETRDGGAVTITCWSGPGEREAWQTRMQMLQAHPHAGAALLRHAGRVKAAQAQLAAATREARARADQARESGLAEATIAALTQPPTDVPPTAPAPASPAPEPGEPAGWVRLPTGRPRPCATCGQDAWYTRDGVALHRGECARADLAAVPSPPRPAEQGPTSAAGGSMSEPLAPEASEAAAPEPEAPVVPAPAEPEDEADPARPRPVTGMDRSRFTAAVAAWDGQQLYLPGHDPVALDPASTDLAALALLVRRYQLGHGGGAAHPARGELLLYPAALEALGLPVDVDRVGHGTRAARARARQELFSQLTVHAAVQDVLAAGWELAGDRLDVRTRLSHPELLPESGQYRPGDLVAISWFDWQGNPLFARDQHEGREELVDPQTLVDRLQEFADRTGAPWRLSGGQTAAEIIDHHHPPARAGSDRPAGRLVFGQDPIQPQFSTPRVRRQDARVLEGERIFNWYRPWESLTEQERAHPYAMAFDHGGHFLGPWQSLELGVGDLVHLVGEEARWDGREIPGYWLVTTWQAPRWDLPDPGDSSGMHLEGNVLVTAHTLKQLNLLQDGFADTLTYLEAFVWGDHTRYLRRAGEVLRDARRDASPPVAAAVKEAYAQGVQKLASLEYPPTQRHLAQPSWRDHIVAAARTSLLRTLTTIEQSTGATPLAVSRDTIIYAVDEDDPRTAWPGSAAKLGTGLGQWKPVAIAPLAQWGPVALPAHQGGPRAWDYGRGMGAMTPIGLTGEQEA